MKLEEDSSCIASGGTYNEKRPLAAAPVQLSQNKLLEKRDSSKLLTLTTISVKWIVKLVTYDGNPRRLLL